MEALKKIDKNISLENSEKSAQSERENSVRLERLTRKEDAYRILSGIVTEFVKNLEDNISNIKIEYKSYHARIILKNAALEITDLQSEIGEFSKSGWDVIAGAKIILQQNDENGINYERSSSLWFTDLGRKKDYHWYEVSYMGILGNYKEWEPYAIDNYVDADLAASVIVCNTQLAHNPKPIDNEDRNEFYQRWYKLLAEASECKLRRPSSFPLEELKKGPLFQ